VRWAKYVSSNNEIGAPGASLSAPSNGVAARISSGAASLNISGRRATAARRGRRRYHRVSKNNGALSSICGGAYLSNIARASGGGGGVGKYVSACGVRKTGANVSAANVGRGMNMAEMIKATKRNTRNNCHNRIPKN
jgi:hypothetical protein